MLLKKTPIIFEICSMVLLNIQTTRTGTPGLSFPILLHQWLWMVCIPLLVSLAWVCRSFVYLVWLLQVFIQVHFREVLVFRGANTYQV